MTCLVKHGQTIVQEDRWPRAEDLGAPVILPGGEIGILLAWWNAEDGSEWRWQVEFYDHNFHLWIIVATIPRGAPIKTAALVKTMNSPSDSPSLQKCDEAVAIRMSTSSIASSGPDVGYARS